MTPSMLIAAVAVHAVASALFLGWLLRYEPRAYHAGTVTTATGALLVAGVLALQLTGRGEPSLGVGALVILLVTFGVTVLFVVSRLRRELALGGPVVVPLATAALFAIAVKAGRPPEAVEAEDAQASALTVVHVGATILGFVLFVPAYVLSLLFLDQEYHLRTKQPAHHGLPGLLRLERMAWRLLYTGFPLYTVGIVLGFVWRGHTSNDVIPRTEHVLAALSWVVYAYAIWRHLQSGWRGRRAALTLIAAFLAMLAAVLLYVMR